MRTKILKSEIYDWIDRRVRTKQPDPPVESETLRGIYSMRKNERMQILKELKKFVEEL